MTQLQSARQGVITPEMIRVAQPGAFCTLAWDSLQPHLVYERRVLRTEQRSFPLVTES
jgi:thiamine biosynthesis protein ThiC